MISLYESTTLILSSKQNLFNAIFRLSDSDTELVRTPDWKFILLIIYYCISKTKGWLDLGLSSLKVFKWKIQRIRKYWIVIYRELLYASSKWAEIRQHFFIICDIAKQIKFAESVPGLKKVSLFLQLFLVKKLNFEKDELENALDIIILF